MTLRPHLATQTAHCGKKEKILVETGSVSGSIQFYPLLPSSILCSLLCYPLLSSPIKLPPTLSKSSAILSISPLSFSVFFMMVKRCHKSSWHGMPHGSLPAKYLLLFSPLLWFIVVLSCDVLFETRMAMCTETFPPAEGEWHDDTKGKKSDINRTKKMTLAERGVVCDWGEKCGRVAVESDQTGTNHTFNFLTRCSLSKYPWNTDF